MDQSGVVSLRNVVLTQLSHTASTVRQAGSSLIQVTVFGNHPPSSLVLQQFGPDRIDRIQEKGEAPVLEGLDGSDMGENLALAMALLGDLMHAWDQGNGQAWELLEVPSMGKAWELLEGLLMAIEVILGELVIFRLVQPLTPLPGSEEAEATSIHSLLSRLAVLVSRVMKHDRFEVQRMSLQVVPLMGRLLASNPHSSSTADFFTPLWKEVINGHVRLELTFLTNNDDDGCVVW